VLNWITATEINNKGFEIERVQGSKANWEKIGYAAGNGTTTESRFYSFTDNNIVPGHYKYRLKQLDFNGAYKYSNEVEVEFNMPDSYGLLQNYPNPFNPETKISFTLPKGEFVTLKIYNSLGEEVAALVNGFREAGLHSVTFSADKYSNGVYLYKVTAGEFTSVKKMILLK